MVARVLFFDAVAHTSLVGHNMRRKQDEGRATHTSKMEEGGMTKKIPHNKRNEALGTVSS